MLDSEMSGVGTYRGSERGQSISALPPTSDVHLFSDIERVIDLNTEIPDRAFDLGVTQ